MVDHLLNWLQNASPTLLECVGTCFTENGPIKTRYRQSNDPDKCIDDSNTFVRLKFGIGN
jgi:hypothetical protein